MNEPIAIVLAAGQGTRMRSPLPKVLVEICGRPMVEYVLDALRRAGVRRILAVVGYRSDLVRVALADQLGVEFVEQSEQHGTGHAVMMCHEALGAQRGAVLILAGDSPLVQADSLRALLDLYARERPACILGTAHKDNPHGLGRIVRDARGNFDRIVEEKEATDDQRHIREVNMSTYVFDAYELRHALVQLTRTNTQGEYYITDCPGILKREGKDVRALPVLKPCEALSINTPEELAQVAAELRRLIEC
jgi:bifunctional UDP-N-acetylglucosamine pyrophosphorylase/glucosamine-1-phosphate N-acetyltransferase/UDP-N-acetylglucosamine pyrophosphorylase